MFCRTACPVHTPALSLFIFAVTPNKPIMGAYASIKDSSFANNDTSKAKSITLDVFLQLFSAKECIEHQVEPSSLILASPLKFAIRC